MKEKPSNAGQISLVVPGVFLGRLQNHRKPFEPMMPEEIPEAFPADGSSADVLVPVPMSPAGTPAIIQMKKRHPGPTDGPLNSFGQPPDFFGRTKIVPGGKTMTGIKTNFHPLIAPDPMDDFAQFFPLRSDGMATTGRILHDQQDGKVFVQYLPDGLDHPRNSPSPAGPLRTAQMGHYMGCS